MKKKRKSIVNFLFTTLCVLFLFTAQSTPVFKIHFIILTDNPDAARIATTIQLQKEIDLLNKNFVSKDGESLVNFEFGSITTFEEIKDSKEPIVSLATSKTPIDQWKREVKFCKDKNIFIPAVINVFIVDSYSDKEGDDERKSYGYHSAYQPYVLIDYSNLNKSGRLFFHEMGHAFGLSHICASKKSVNIMSDPGVCKVNKVNDEVETNPLTEDQINRIKKQADLYEKNFKLYDPSKYIQNSGFENQLIYWNFPPQRFRLMGKTGKYSAYLKENETIEQSFTIEKNGSFELKAAFYIPVGKSNFGVKINDKIFKSEEININAEKKFTEYSIPGIKVNKGDIITIYAACSEGWLLADDFEFIE